jgi:hypothetical protein
MAATGTGGQDEQPQTHKAALLSLFNFGLTAD